MKIKTIQDFYCPLSIKKEREKATGKKKKKKLLAKSQGWGELTVIEVRGGGGGGGEEKGGQNFLWEERGSALARSLVHSDKSWDPVSACVLYPVSVCVCVSACVLCECVCVCVCVCVCECLCESVWVCEWVCVSVCECVCVSACVWVHVCECECMCVRVSVRVSERDRWWCWGGQCVAAPPSSLFYWGTRKCLPLAKKLIKPLRGLLFTAQLLEITACRQKGQYEIAAVFVTVPTGRVSFTVPCLHSHTFIWP